MTRAFAGADLPVRSIRVGVEQKKSRGRADRGSCKDIEGFI